MTAKTTAAAAKIALLMKEALSDLATQNHQGEWAAAQDTAEYIKDLAAALSNLYQ
jgi:hypothetical protein